MNTSGTAERRDALSGPVSGPVNAPATAGCSLGPQPSGSMSETRRGSAELSGLPLSAVGLTTRQRRGAEGGHVPAVAEQAGRLQMKRG